ncbi:MAG: hypothetical protein ACO3HN_06325, partial [Opitutales bacterium]
MAEHKLSILIEALGAAKANQSLKGVDKTISSIGSHASRGFKNAANNLKTIGVIAAGFVAANVYKGIESLEDLERVTNQTAAVIKSTGGVAGVTATQVRELSQSLEELTTVDDKAIQGGANLLLTFTGIGKETFPRATKAMVDMAIALAQGDVEAANFQTTAIQIGKALNDPVKGMTALRKSGVSFTAEQIKQVKTLVKSGKTLAAQEIILAELEKEFGKAGEAAAKGFGGDMRRFQDAVEDAQQALAIGFLPLIRDVATELSTKLKDPKTLERIRELGIGLAAGFRKLMDFAGRIPWGTIGDSLKTAGAGAKAIFDAFLGLPPWVQTAVISGWGLNKLTGGALGSIVGELGKGLIKGVLNTNAAVMNVRAGVVNGLGGAGGAAGAAAGSRFGVLAGFAKMIGLGAGIGIAAGSNAAGPGGQISGEGFLGNLGGGALAGASVAGPVGMFAGAMIGLVKSVSEVESGINTAMAQQAHANMQQGTGLAGASASELTTKLAAID